MSQREIIYLENLRKTYELGAVTINALRDISLVDKENEYLALMGPSGSGKST